MTRALFAATLALAACDLGTVTVPSTTPSIVVHAVLNTSAPNQIVLLERTLTGAAPTTDSIFNAADPIVSGGGIPIDSAVVEITDSTGRTFEGIEDSSVPGTNGVGRGVYRFTLAGFLLIGGGRYRLHIHTLQGEDAIAYTRVPRADVTSAGGLTRTFNRDHDTLNIVWNRAASARTYAVRIESPFGPLFLFTDSVSVRISGALRNPFANELQHVFIPGFRQDALVTAVDSNFYDYYRTNNDPFTGSGIINRISGGIGVFGAVAILNTGTISVVADQTEPIEGRFRATPAGNQQTFANRLTLYIESKAASPDLPDALSGQYTVFGTNARIDALLGRQSGETVVLALLRNQQVADTEDVFVGRLNGDTLTGAFRTHGGPVVYVRNP